MAWFFDSFSNLLITVASCVIIYSAIILITRIAGLRTFAKMSAVDFAVTIALGSVLASVMTSPTTVAQGIISLICLVGLQFVVALGKRRSRLISSAVSNTPLLLMDGPRILYDNLAKGNIAESELRAKLREANVLRLSQVRAVVLETTGDVSVLHSDQENMEIEEWILRDIRT